VASGKANAIAPTLAQKWALIGGTTSPLALHGPVRLTITVTPLAADAGGYTEPPAVSRDLSDVPPP